MLSDLLVISVMTLVGVSLVLYHSRPTNPHPTLFSLRSRLWFSGVSILLILPIFSTSGAVAAGWSQTFVLAIGSGWLLFGLGLTLYQYKYPADDARHRLVNQNAGLRITGSLLILNGIFTIVWTIATQDSLT